MTGKLTADLNFTRLCRCCALRHNSMYDIFDGTCSNSQTYYEVIMECAPVQIRRDDGLPSVVCHECVSTLESFVVFRRKCVETESILKRTSSNISTPNKQETYDLIRSTLDNMKEETNDIDTTESVDPQTNWPDMNSQVGRADFEIKFETVFIQASNIISPDGQETYDSNRVRQNSLVLDDIKEGLNDLDGVVKLETEIDEPETNSLREIKSNDETQPIENENRPDTISQAVRSDSKIEKRCTDEKTSFNRESNRTTRAGEQRHSCDKCTKTFKFKSSLDQHQRTHSHVKPYSCDKCGRSFKHKSNLNGHRKIHTGEKPYSCDTCGKSFKHKPNLSVHEKIHTGEKPYSCDTCDKSFILKWHLEVHEKTHNGVRPFACDECDKTFPRKALLNRHQKTHTGERQYSCDKCEKSFSLKWNLGIHQKIHTGEKPYPCDECEKSFNRKWDLSIHRKTHTGEKPFPCDRCDRSFNRKALLNQHQKVHAGEKSLSEVLCTFDY